MKPLVYESSASSDIYAELPRLLSRNRDLAVATVAAITGSAPQKAGSSAVFDGDRLVAGTIGGGVVEFSVQKLAMEHARMKNSSLHSFRLSNEISDREGAICGGSMEILLDADPVKHLSVFEAVKESLERREAGVMFIKTSPAENERMEIERAWLTAENLSSKKGLLTDSVYSVVNAMLQTPAAGDFRRTSTGEQAGSMRASVFLQPVVPPPRLVIAGAGHVGKALLHLGKMVGFEVIVWDYRSEYVTRENLPDADILLSGDFDSTLGKIKTDLNTYIVTVTTGHKQDIEILRKFIGSPAGYIGMIGSRKKTLLMREHFLSEGWATAEQWERVHAPVGIDIRSETVEEIALSIAAQLVQVRHQLNKRQ